MYLFDGAPIKNGEKRVRRIFVSYVYDVNNVYLLSFYVQFPDIQTQTGGGECTHIVQLITYGSIQRDGTTESHI